MRRLWLLSFLFPTIAGGLPLTRKNDGATAVAPPNAASLQTGSQGFSNRKRANEDGDLAGLIAEDILYRAYIQFGTDGWADMQECVEREVQKRFGSPTLPGRVEDLIASKRLTEDEWTKWHIDCYREAAKLFSARKHANENGALVETGEQDDPSSFQFQRGAADTMEKVVLGLGGGLLLAAGKVLSGSGGGVGGDRALYSTWAP